MPELLLELFSEEIPARMQTRGATDLKRLVTEGLKASGLSHESAEAFATPRRLALVVTGVPDKQPDVKETRRGPKADAPAKAIDGFLTSVGLTREEVRTEKTAKGTYLVADIEKAGRPTAQVLAELLPHIIRTFPWPKSMRWTAGNLRWVRPLHGIACLFGGEVVRFEVESIQSGDTTFGHRFMAPQPFTVTGFADYRRALADAYVLLDGEDRKARIHEAAQALCAEAGMELVKDPALLEEVAGLVEWPVMLRGRIGPEFVKPLPAGLPPEVLESAMRTHQRYFSVRDPQTGGPGPYFLAAANLVAKDGGRAIIEGNERVLRARLADAQFFWAQDCRQKLADRVEKLNEVVFHARLGTMFDKAKRMSVLAGQLAGFIPGCQEEQVGQQVSQAARLAKADLTTEMVHEFPELQGVMGRYYALMDGEAEAVANAVRDHYAPQGPNDHVPAEPVSIAVALADKLDTLVGFWAIGETPTGSKDPYALRRAALGVIRIVLENGLRLKLKGLIKTHPATPIFVSVDGSQTPDISDDLLSFFADRLKVHLREQGARHDLVDAVFALEGQDDLVLIVRRVEALSDFLATPDGANLLTAYERAANILRIEEKRDNTSFAEHPDPALFTQDEERALFDRIAEARAEADSALQREDFVAAMAAMARLRAPVDTFFDKVTVNAEDPALRANRLRLLAQIRATLDMVADFSRIEG